MKSKFARKPTKNSPKVLRTIPDTDQKFFLLWIKPFVPNKSYKRSGGAIHKNEERPTDKRYVSRAEADFWRIKSGDLLVIMKVKCSGYSARYYFRAFTREGLPIPVERLLEFADYVTEQLIEWLNWPADPPDCFEQDEALFNQIWRAKAATPTADH